MVWNINVVIHLPFLPLRVERDKSTSKVFFLYYPYISAL